MTSPPAENYANNSSNDSCSFLLSSLMTPDEKTSAKNNTALHINNDKENNNLLLCYNSATAVPDNTAIVNVNIHDNHNKGIGDNEDANYDAATATAEPSILGDVEGILLCDKIKFNNNNNNNKDNKNSNNSNNNNNDEKKISDETSLINHNRMDDNSNDSSSGHEKSDAPEKLNKFEHDVTQNSLCTNQNLMDDTPVAASTHAVSAGQLSATKRAAAITSDADGASESAVAKTAEAEAEAQRQNALKRSLAFTIDYANEENKLDAETKAAKYKSMLERFQNRHKRIAAAPSSPTVENDAQNEQSSKKNNAQQLRATAKTVELTAVMPRARSAQHPSKDFVAKRRSWSPRAFENAAKETTPNAYQQQQRINKLQQQQRQQQHQQNHLANKRPTMTTTITKTSTTATPRSDNHTDEQYYNECKKYFQPRSTVMQMAMQKIDYVCTKPLVDDFKSFKLKDDNDNDNDGDKISETGTYTLEGDTYTEEQKEYMNIDKNKLKLQHKIANLKTSQLYQQHQFHDKQMHDDDDAHVNIVVDADDDKSDVGCITSVTTSGVLSKSNTSTPRSQQQHQSMYGCVARKTTPNNCLDVLKIVENSSSTRSNNNNNNNISSCSSHNLMENTSDIAILKTAQTRKDWVQEWARNARARSLANDYVSNVNDDYNDDDGDNNDLLTSPTTTTATTTSSSTSGHKLRKQTAQQQLMSQSLNNSREYDNENSNEALMQRLHFNRKYNNNINTGNNADVSCCSETSSLRSPTATTTTKIPSPIHTNRRAKSNTRINAVANMLLYGESTENTSQKNAAGKLTLNNNTNDNNNNNNSSSSKKKLNTKLQRSDLICTQLPQQQQQQEKLFSKNNLMTASYNEKRQHRQPKQQQFESEHDLTSFRLRKNSCDGNIEYRQRLLQQQQRSPLRKSSGTAAGASTSMGMNLNSSTPRSTSNTNFRQMYEYIDNDDDDMAYYVQDMDDELSSNDFSMAAGQNQQHQDDDDYDDGEIYEEQETLSADPVVMSHYKSKFNAQALSSPPVNGAATTNTRYNKTLLMRIQNSKQQQQRAGSHQDNGIAACPNTPELPRRGIMNNSNKSGGPRARGALAGRMSEPRDNSVCRRNDAPQVPKSLALAKKHLLQTAASGRAQSAGLVNTAHVQPKYMNISRFQSSQSKQFLRKNEARSTLKPAGMTTTTPTSTTSANISGTMKRSPSASGGLCRNDSTRTSKGSVRGVVPACMTSSGTTLSGNAHGLARFHNFHNNPNSCTTSAATRSPASRFDSYPTKQKEAEMAMWKRRSTYDPMRAAAEDRRRKEELKRQALARM